MPVMSPPWSAYIVNPIENSKAFLMALTRLLVMIGSHLHRSHAHQTTLCTLHATADCTYSVSFRLEQHIWPWWSEAVAPPPSYALYISLASNSALPVCESVTRGSYLISVF